MDAMNGYNAQAETWTRDLFPQLLTGDQDAPTVPIGICRRCMRTYALRMMAVERGDDRFFRYLCIWCDGDARPEGERVTPRMARVEFIPAGAIIG
jgi:hypothetical protein